MTEPILEVRNLKKYFSTPGGMLHAVDNVSFSIPEGSTLGVVGESGCGKSTLGRVILRLLEATDGEIFYRGVNIRKFNSAQMREHRRKMQIIFQDPYESLNPRMSVSELIAEPLIVNEMNQGKQERNQRVAELMETVGLSERLVNSYPHELDGGRRQRIGIARALAMNPEFIVCDEPVSALDVSIQAQILNLMQDLQKEHGFTYMFITHNMSVVKHISDEIIVMYLGEIVERAPKEELFRNPCHPYTKALLEAIPIPSLSSRGRKREVIRGEIKSPINPPTGCRFAARCRFATEQCKAMDPETVEVSPGHWVLCEHTAKL